MPDSLDGAGGGANEPIASDGSELETLECGIDEVFTATRDTLHQTVAVDDSSFCWISDYRGGVDSLSGDGTHWPRAQLQLGSTFWNASSSNDGDFGISCVPLACFFSNGGAADVRWISEGNHAAQSSGTLTHCFSASANAWWGDAATVLNGWEGSGHTTTTGDRAFVTQNNLSGSPSTLTNRDCTFIQDVGSARMTETTSLFVGIPGGDHQAAFRGPNSTRSYGILNAGDYVAKSWDSSHTQLMADVDEGICYFSYLAGDFHLPEDGAKIYPAFVAGRWRWILRTVKSSGGNNSSTGIRAHARCYLYDQHQ
jgi:hypothetical protein